MNDQDRHKPLRNLLLVAELCSGFRLTSFTPSEIHSLYQSDIGNCSERTIRRYMTTLEKAGILAVTRPQGNVIYRWVGWPGEKGVLRAAGGNDMEDGEG